MAQGITLGDMAFTNHGPGGGLTMENPEAVKFGLKEQIVIHKMIGGARILDMMGDDPEDISWSGTFLGPNAVDRAQRLYTKQQEKKLQNLIYGLYTATVVVSQLDLTYKKAYWVDYSITCVVVDQAIGGGGVGGIAGGATNILGLVAPALANPIIAGANLLFNGVNTATDAANALLAGVNGLQAAATTVLAPVTNVVQQVNGVVQQANNAVNQVTGTINGVVQQANNTVNQVTGTVNGIVQQGNNVANQLTNTVNNVGNLIGFF